MKNSFITVLVVLMFAACGPEKSIRIEGTLIDTNAEKICLNELGREDISSGNDTVQIDAKGKFAFKRKISQPTFYSLTVNNRAITLLLHPGEKAVIRGDARHLPLTYTVDGSNDSQHIRQLYQRLEHTVMAGDSLERILKQYEGNRNFVNIQRQFEWNYINEIDSLKAYNIRFMEKNPRSLVVIYALYQQLGRNIYLFNQEDDIRYFRRADSAFHKRYPKIPYVNTLHANVLKMNEQYNATQLNRMLHMLGENAPEIALPAPDGKVVKLSLQKGKYVLIDFWASWSAPCRTENANLLNVYNKYHDKGFEIFQVSLDEDKSLWERAIREDKLPWINVSNLKVWESEAVKLYGVEALPANFLLDRDGNIVTKNLKSDALDSRLSEFLTATE